MPTPPNDRSRNAPSAFNEVAKFLPELLRITPLSHLLTPHEWVESFSRASIPAPLRAFLPSKTRLYADLAPLVPNEYLPPKDYAHPRRWLKGERAYKPNPGGLGSNARKVSSSPLRYTHAKRIDGHEMRGYLFTRMAQKLHQATPPVPYEYVTPEKGDGRRAVTQTRFQQEVRAPGMIWVPTWRLAWWYEPFDPLAHDEVLKRIEWGIMEGRIPAIRSRLTGIVSVSPTHTATAVFLRVHVATRRHPPYLVDRAFIPHRWPLEDAARWHRLSITYRDRDRAWPMVIRAELEGHASASVVVTHYHIEILAERMLAAIRAAHLPPEEKITHSVDSCLALARAYAHDKKEVKDAVSEEVAPRYFPSVSLWRGGLYVPVQRADAWIAEWVGRKEWAAQRTVA